MKCCCLEGITGQYWKYQNEGHAAVSTIEAIAYTAYDAGLNEFENDLLLLFKLQVDTFSLSILYLHLIYVVY